MYIVISYAGYLVVSLALTVWVAATLRRHGRVVLVDALQGNAKLADTVNHLHLMCFYLISTGYVVLTLRINTPLNSARDVIEMLRDKIGWVLLVLGLAYFFNLYLLHRLRKRGPELPAPRHFGPGAMGKVLD